MAVVAVCIAYIQLTVTQCGIFIEHAIFQNYVADFAFGCGYFAVFIYNQFAVGSIECTVAVYEERYSAVFICSTYGQVVFCVQCVGLNGVYINIFIQLNLNIGTIIADFNVLVAAEINNFAGSYIGCFGCNTVGGKIPAFICICSYLFDFFQLAYIYSISIINAFSYVSDYFIVSIQAIFGDVSIAAKTNAHIIIHEEFTSMNAVNIKVSAKFNLNGRAKKFLCCTYDDISFVTVKVNIIARLYLSSCCYSTINRQIPTFVSVIRCRISSHRRSHACTGHNTCCNQHCQQLLVTAAFTAMIFCDFGNNNISVACFAPNYFKNFVHQKFLLYKYILYNVRSTRCVWEQVKQLLY